MNLPKNLLKDLSDPGPGIKLSVRVFYFSTQLTIQPRSETQNINEWEQYIRMAHEQGKQIYITGSNAIMTNQILINNESFELFNDKYKSTLSL